MLLKGTRGSTKPQDLGAPGFRVRTASESLLQASGLVLQYLEQNAGLCA